MHARNIATHTPQAQRSGLWLTATNIVLLIVLQLPLAGFFAPGDSQNAQIVREAIYWMLTAALIGYVVFVERRRVASIGLLRPTWKSLAVGLAAGFIMVAGMAFIYLVVFPTLGLGAEEQQMNSIAAMPLWFRVTLALRAAVFEELLYRGFAIERLAELLRSRWFAATVSLAVFTYEHLDFWGWPHLIIAGFGGAVLTGMYLWRRDLISNMIAHFFTDAVGFLLV